MPNGEGKIIFTGFLEDKVTTYVSVRSGNFENGLKNGPFIFEDQYGDDETIHRMEAFFDMGIPKDRTEEFFAVHDWFELPAGEIVYAFEETGRGWFYHTLPESIMGVEGFTN